MSPRSASATGGWASPDAAIDTRRRSSVMLTICPKCALTLVVIAANQEAAQAPPDSDSQIDVEIDSELLASILQVDLPEPPAPTAAPPPATPSPVSPPRPAPLARRAPTAASAAAPQPAAREAPQPAARPATPPPGPAPEAPVRA